MSTRTDTAAQAAIGAAARDLHLPTVRDEATPLAEIAVRERQSHLGFLAEVLTAEVDDRNDRRRTRRIAEAKFPRLKRLSEFNLDAVPSIAAAQLATLANGAWIDAGEPVVLLPRKRGDPQATQARAKPTYCSDSGSPPASKDAGSATSPARSWSTNWSRPPTNGNCPAWSAATPAWTCCYWTNWATSKSTPEEQSCCSRSSPNAKNAPASGSEQICPSANGAPWSPTHA